MPLHDNIQSILDKTTSGPDGVPGCAFAAMNRNGEFLTVNAAGQVGKDDDTPLKEDAIFWLASCTKVVAGMALLQLVEQGKVKLDDPVETILPELKNREIISGGKKRKSSMPITLRMLLSHTSGLSYTFFNEDIKKLSQASGIDEFGGTFDGIDTPLVHEPGERFTYGVGIDWAGLLLERVTGMQLGAYIEKHIFEPLGVKDSTFDLDKRPDLAKRLTHLNYRNPEGKVSARQHFPIAKKQPFHSGGGGMFSNVKEYVKLLSPLINEGKGFNGAQILKPETVKLAFEDQLSHIKEPLEGVIPSFTPEYANAGPIFAWDSGTDRTWGLTFLKTNPAIFTGRGQGSGWWAGLCNNFWWADPAKGIVGVIMSQMLPFGDAQVFGAWIEAETAVYASLDSGDGAKL